MVGRGGLRKMYNWAYDLTFTPKRKNASRPVDPQVCQSRGVFALPTIIYLFETIYILDG